MILLFIILASILFVDLQDQPPGTLQVAENLYWDKTEISNRHYSEYLKWLLNIYGKDSDTLKNAIPNLKNIDTLARSLKTDANTYLTGIEFELYPVVGVSMKQAEAFCKWRSARIYDWMLQDSTGRYRGKQHSSLMVELLNSVHQYGKWDRSKVRFPEYRLPAPGEWLAIRDHRRILKGIYKKLYPLPYYVGNDIHSFNDNVSEITSTPGISVGGNHQLKLNSKKEPVITPYNGSAYWLGFRCVCSFKENL